MGGFDGAEVCELEGLYLLFRLTDGEKIFQKDDICLYRDDGLSAVEASGPDIDRMRKETIRIFKEGRTQDNMGYKHHASLFSRCFSRFEDWIVQTLS